MGAIPSQCPSAPSARVNLLALVEPDLNAGRTQRIAYVFGGLRILGRVAQEHRLAGLGQCTHLACKWSGLKACGWC